jgi:hypothetical protein
MIKPSLIKTIINDQLQAEGFILEELSNNTHYATRRG